MRTAVCLLQGSLLMVFLTSPKAYTYEDDIYSVVDEMEGDESDDDGSPKKVDYTRYFGGTGQAPYSAQIAQPATGVGLVQPIGFPSFFPPGSFGETPTIATMAHQPALYTATNLPLVPGLMPIQGNYSNIGYPNPIALHNIYLDSSVVKPTPHLYGNLQQSSSPSIYLPHFDMIRASITREVADGQNRVSLDNTDKSASANRESEEYDSIQDEGEEGEGEEEYESEDGEESSSEPHPGKSSYPQKPGYYKEKSYSKNKSKKGSSDYGYTSPFDYPKTGLDDSDEASKESSEYTRVKPLPLQPANKQKHPAHYHYQTPYKPPQTLYPTFVANPKQVPKNAQTQSVYMYNRKPSIRPVGSVSLHSGFVPSAPIPYTNNFPSYKMHYIPPIGSIPLNKNPNPTSQLTSATSQKSNKLPADQDTKKCTKIEKEMTSEDMKRGRFKREPMICYSCHDSATGANYEQCSYDSEKKPVRKEESKAEKIVLEKTVKPHKFRRKRDVASPYDYSFSQDMNKGHSVTLIRKVRQYSEYDDGYDTPYGTSDEENYRFGPEYFKDDGQRDESTQDVVESESGEDCRKVKKDGIICVVCQKPSGGSYEQCSYASDPKENSYSYGTSRRYGHGSRPQKRKKYQNKRQRRFSVFDYIPDDENHRRKVRQNSNRRHDPFDEDFAESVSRIHKTGKHGLVGLDPFFYGSPEETYHPEEIQSRQKKPRTYQKEGSEEEEESVAESAESAPAYDDYFSRLFPDLGQGRSRRAKKGDEEVSDEEDGEGGESQQSKKELMPEFDFQGDYFDDTDQQEDLEKVLGEFTQKDRSSCKKVMKDKMTCYQCVDKEGMQHEECMFVAASEPKNKHLAYHEVKQYRLAPKEEELKEKLSSTKPITFEQPDSDFETLKKKRRTKEEPALQNEESKPEDEVDTDSQAAENFDILRLQPRESPVSTNGPVSTVTIQNQRFFSSTGSSPDGQTQRRKRRFPDEEYMMASPSEQEYYRRDYDEEARRLRKRKRRQRPKSEENTNEEKKSYDPIPTDPPNFEIPEGPEGAYSADTEPAFDTVLKISLPKYMLEKSEHEDAFDEVLASG